MRRRAPARQDRLRGTGDLLDDSASMLHRISRPRAAAGLAAGVALAGLAAWFALSARRAEKRHPPVGRFIHVDGVRLHYLEVGSGPPLVLLHGNGSLIQEFVASGLVAQAAERYRVIVFDRPGYGYSSRPRGRVWTPEAQARLVHAALERLGVRDPVVLGHSWGALVAAAYGLLFPRDTRALVLASGYFYPSVRFDVPIAAISGVPLVGAVLRYTVTPLTILAIWPLLMRRLFGPAEIPRRFEAFPRQLALRPTHLRACAAEAALMIPAAIRLARHYRELAVPTVVAAGRDDRQVDAHWHSEALHGAVTGSRLHLVPGVGHMLHQNAPAAVMAAIVEADSMAGGSGGSPSADRAEARQDERRLGEADSRDEAEQVELQAVARAGGEPGDARQ